ncbi:MAG: CotH kinase family protein [Planctomycetaceae bacterium]|nr:CotH kinase family protein [Planctomycetaceae bacterium]
MNQFRKPLNQYLLSLLAVVVVGATAAPARASKKLDAEELLNPERVVEVRIELSPSDWNQLRQQQPNPAAVFGGLPAPSPYTWFRGDVWLDGEKISSVGVRKKGFLGSTDNVRPSLLIKFDEFEDLNPVKGLGRLVLNNNKQDRSLASQFLSYQLFNQAGLHAPRSNWANVTVNGQHLGVYSHVEPVRKPFLKRCFEDGTGTLYEGSLTDFHPRALGTFDQETNEDHTDHRDIGRLAELLERDGPLDLNEIDRIINLDAFMRYWALEGLTGFWDGYSGNQNNFFVYFDPSDSGRAVFIPWGTDWLFSDGGPMNFGGGQAQIIYAQSILANRLYHTEGISNRYQTTMKDILSNVWDEQRMLAEVDRIEKLVTPHLHPSQSDAPQAMGAMRDFIRRRRSTAEQLLADWRPRIPPIPREPAHVIPRGTLQGTFAASFKTEMPSDTVTASTLKLSLGDGKSEPADQALTDIQVTIEEFRFPSFG